MQAIFQFKAISRLAPNYITRQPVIYTFRARVDAKFVSFRAYDEHLAICLLVNDDSQEEQEYEVTYADLGAWVEDDLVLLDERYDDGFPVFLFTKPGQLGK